MFQVMSLVAALSLAGPALAADDEAGPPAPKPEEVIVYGDPFARWDNTRWYIETQIGLPLPYVLFATNNQEFEPVNLQVRMTMGCEKTWRRSKKLFEVDCHIEDIGIQAASWRPSEPYAEEILKGFDQKLTGADIQLIVSDDGRLTNIDLEGVEGDNDREKALREQARMLLVRVMAGFHMRLPPRNQIQQGQWVEYDSTLFQIPIVQRSRDSIADSSRVGGGGNYSSNRAPIIANTMSGSYIIHQLDRYKGHLVVQSLGEGTIKVGDEDTGDESFFKVNLDSVSIFDEGTGIMTERVWAVRGRTTAGSFLAEGRADPVYFHNGRFKQLGDSETPDVGPTQRCARPAELSNSLPAWKPID